ncbi:uncharacterized protein G2W53_002554 [Senna tora]|uniref:Uncharacterized protein n=1 Tax=Senna tora TaxID=362788 RepID=A0A835CG34_9FABA|nr:uncharacterized protein G2W53_002554 [Senna tora]
MDPQYIRENGITEHNYSMFITKHDKQS